MIPVFAFAGIAGRLPDASSMSPRVDAVFFTLLAVCGFIVALLVALNLTFLVRYRRGSNAPRGPLRLSTWKIEVGWIGGTLIVFLGFFGWGAWVYLEMERPPPDAYVVDVVARQWMWDIRHPNGRREFDTLHVPVNRPIRLRMISEDVIHSLFIPAFRVKQDVVPGKTVSTWLEATQPGSYHLFCTQFCGTKHAGMIGEVVAQAPEAYAAWLEAGNVDGTIADRGRRLFLRYGCSGCHAASSAAHAPALEGIYQTLVPIEGGGFVRADDGYLRDSILEPTKHIAAGFQPVMPSFKGIIPEGDLLALIGYLRSLRNEAPALVPAPSRP